MKKKVTTLCMVFAGIVAVVEGWRKLMPAEPDLFVVQWSSLSHVAPDVREVASSEVLERLRQYSSHWTFVVRNGGEASAEDVVLTVPAGMKSLLWQLPNGRLFSDTNPHPDMSKRVDLGTLRPGDQVYVGAWSGLWPDQVKGEAAVRHKGGSGVVARSAPHFPVTYGLLQLKRVVLPAGAVVALLAWIWWEKEVRNRWSRMRAVMRAYREDVEAEAQRLLEARDLVGSAQPVDSPRQ